MSNSLAYMALFIAITNGDWVLLAAIKLMSAVFSAFDRPIYQRLVPQHLADVLCFPPQLLELLKKGAMSVRLTQSVGRAVALDETHEMKINKDANLLSLDLHQSLWRRLLTLCPFAPSVKTTYASN